MSDRRVRGGVVDSHISRHFFPCALVRVHPDAVRARFRHRPRLGCRSHAGAALTPAPLPRLGGVAIFLSFSCVHGRGRGLVLHNPRLQSALSPEDAADHPRCPHRWSSCSAFTTIFAARALTSSLLCRPSPPPCCLRRPAHRRHSCAVRRHQACPGSSDCPSPSSGCLPSPTPSI